MQSRFASTATKKLAITTRSIREVGVTARLSCGNGETKFTKQYTSHLVPPLLYSLTQERRQLPDVGFRIAHLGGPHPVKVRIGVALAQGEVNYGLISSVHYDGTCMWNLNPRFVVSAHFAIPTDLVNKLPKDAIRARIDVTVFDIYGRPHKLLPVGYVLASANADWYLEPSEQVLGIPAALVRPDELLS